MKHSTGRSFDRETALKLLCSCLRPLVKFCLRHGLHLQDIVECSKVELISAAHAELRKQQTKASASRISIMTGIHRPDVNRLSISSPKNSTTQDLITRVMGLWQTAPEFLLKNGKPRTLTYKGENSEFNILVKRVSRDPNPGTVLAELRRLGFVEDVRGCVALRATSHVSKGDPAAGFNILATDIDDLSRAVEENVLCSNATPHFHARTEFDNVRFESLEKLRTWLVREGHRFHAEMRQTIGAEDQDVNPLDGRHPAGARIVVGAFSYVELPEGEPF